MENKISIIIPTYNEAENIQLLIKSIINELSDKNYEIIVVDDNSPDGTSKIVTQLKEKYSCIRLLIRKTDRGLVPSIRDGINYASGTICIWMDGDLSMSPKVISDIVLKIEKGADLVVGSRYIHGGAIKGSDHRGDKTPAYTLWKNLTASEDSLISAIISKVGNMIIRFILQVELHDFSSGYFGAKTSTLNTLKLEGGIVDYCISLPYKAIMKGYKVTEVPMTLDTRKFGQSKTSNSIFEIIKIGFQCYKRTIQLKLTVRDERNKKNNIRK